MEYETRPLPKTPPSQHDRPGATFATRLSYLGRLSPSRRREGPGDTFHGIEYARLRCAAATDRVAALPRRAHRVLARAHATRRRHRACHALPGWDAEGTMGRGGGGVRMRTPGACACARDGMVHIQPPPATQQRTTQSNSCRRLRSTRSGSVEAWCSVRAECPI